MAFPRLLITCANTHYTAIYLQGIDTLSEQAQYTVIVDTLDISPLQQGLGQTVFINFIANDNNTRPLNTTLLAIEDKGLVGANTDAKIAQKGGVKRRYQLTLGSRLSLLQGTLHSRIFIDTHLTDILTLVLADAGYHSEQITFAIAAPLPVLGQCVQAMESNHTFFNRLLRQYGLFYWFNSINSQAGIVISDNNQSSPYLERGLLTVHHGNGFNPEILPSQLVNDIATKGFVGFTQCQYSTHIHTGLANAIANNYRGEGEELAEHNFAQPVSTTHDQAGLVAKNQSLALNRFQHVVTLTGNVPDIFAGCSFSLHDDSGIHANGDYLCISVEHFCQQPSDQTSQEGLTQYYCVVNAIPRATPFKLPFVEFPPLPTVFSAKVESISAAPTLTNEGEYFTKAGFDETAKAPLTSTLPLRKLVNYACANQPQATGWHFPLANDTHVLLGCFNNDPSQAYLVGFDMNEDQPSVVNSDNNTHNRLLSRAGHELRFDDHKKIPTIILQTLGGGNYLELNAHKEGAHYIKWLSRLGSIHLHSAQHLLFYTDTGNIDVSINGYQHIQAKNSINIEAKRDKISYKGSLEIQSATHYNQTAQGMSLTSQGGINLLTGARLTTQASNTITVQSEQGDVSITAPQGSTLINADGNIRIEGTGNGDITLFNQGGMLKLDNQGNVELIGTDALTLNGQIITFDGEVSYDNQSPTTAPEPSTVQPQNMGRLADVNIALASDLHAPSQIITLKYTYQDGEAVQEAPYIIALSDGTEIKGALDKNGHAELGGMPAGRFTVQYGEDVREYTPVEDTTPNPLYGKITPQAAIAMLERGDTGLLSEAADIAASAGDWLWGTLQGDFNENPSTSQIVVGSIISMIPVIDQVMDCRDICANAMVLTDDNDANDTNGWIALALTGIGFIPVFGSAIKGVGKVVIKNASRALSPALAVMRKLGKGDPVRYLRQVDWDDITQQATTLIKEKIVAFKEALLGITESWFIKKTLSDSALASIRKNADMLAQILPSIEQGIKEGVQNLQQRLNKALDGYIGEIPHSGKTGDVKKTKTVERKPERGNELIGAPPIKRLRNPVLDKHYQTLDEYEALYKQKLDDAIKNGDSPSRIGAFKGKLTEAKGERAASAYMEKHFSKPPPPAQMELGFGPGPGIDQIWAKRDKDGHVLEYFIVEAKGPGAKLQETKTKGMQMSDRWVKSNINSMTNSRKYPDRNQLGQELLDAIEDQEPEIKKLVIEAIENNGKVVGGKLQSIIN